VPDNQEAVYQSELLRRGGVAVSWSWASGAAAADAALGFDAPPGAAADEPGVKYLIDLTPDKYEGLVNGDWDFGKGTMSGKDSRWPLAFGGKPAPRGLGVHPTADGESRLTYTLRRGQFQRLIGGAGVSDSSAAEGSPGS